MEQLSVWVRAGLVTAGVSAALLAGAGAADADPGAEPGSESGPTASASNTPGADAANEKKDDKRRPGAHRLRPPSRDVGVMGVKKDAADAKDTEGADDVSTPEAADADARPVNRATSRIEARKKKVLAVVAAAARDTKDNELADEKVEPRPTTSPTTTPAAPAVTEGSAGSTGALANDVVSRDVVSQDVVLKDVVLNDVVLKDAAAQFFSNTSLTSMPIAQRSTALSATPSTPLAVLAAVGSVIGAVVTNVGSATLIFVQAVEAAVTGPPVLPPGSTVTVKSSSITLSTGQVVPADWYYPEVKEGDPPPTRMILLSHGLLALGPMYSYTAANMAQETNSIVVAPSIPSNFFAGDDYWLGGTGMSKAVADLFVGDRDALTQSALDAGYAEQYGLDPATAELPQKFALAGHSLGGSLVMGAAGFLAENGAAKDLVGVILLDGVPTGTTAADALRKLDEYDARTPGDQYVPIRAIGAPLNLFNFPSNINEALAASRPDRFNGVVLAGGVHMDSMRGGNPLIQFGAYLVAGFPQPQNPPAVDALSAEWLNQWFAGQKDVGDDLQPGSTIPIVTPQGTAHGVVIGKPAAVPLPWSAPAAIPALDPWLARIAA